MYLYMYIFPKINMYMCYDISTQILPSPSLELEAVEVLRLSADLVDVGSTLTSTVFTSSVLSWVPPAINLKKQIQNLNLILLGLKSKSRQYRHWILLGLKSKSRQYRHCRPKSRIRIIKFCVNRSNVFKVKWNFLTYKCDLGGREDFLSCGNGSIVWFNNWLCNISGRCGCIAGTLCDCWRSTGCRGDNYWISGGDGFSQSCV